MSVAFDPVGDFIAVCDGLEGVTLTERDGDEQDIDHALRRAVTLKEAAASNGFFTTADVHWHLPVSEVSGQPELGATITDDEATDWTILQTERQTLSDRWRCTCRNLVVVERLDTLVEIQIATVTQGDTGAHETAWAPLMEEVRGRIQRAYTRTKTAQSGGARQTTEIGTRTIEAEFTLFMREVVAGGLTIRHRIVDSAGNRYRIVGYRDPERIDKLTEVDLVPWTETYKTGGLG